MASGLEDTLLPSPHLFLPGYFDAGPGALSVPQLCHPSSLGKHVSAWSLEMAQQLLLPLPPPYLRADSYSPGNHSLSLGRLVSHFLGSLFYAGFSGSLMDV